MVDPVLYLHCEALAHVGEQHVYVILANAWLTAIVEHLDPRVGTPSPRVRQASPQWQHPRIKREAYRNEFTGTNSECASAAAPPFISRVESVAPLPLMVLLEVFRGGAVGSVTALSKDLRACRGRPPDP